MIQFVATALIFLIIGGSKASANAVNVNGGEHPGFTRVLLEFEDLTEWQTERIGRGYRINFADASLSFDLSEAFRLIGRDRISDIRIVNGGLEFDIACDCSFSVSKIATQVLSAEVRPREAGNPLTMSEVVAFNDPPDQDSPVVTLATSKAIVKERLTPEMAKEPELDRLFDPTRVLPINNEPVRLGDIEDLLNQPDEGVAIELLSQQLSRAVAQGLIDTNRMIAERPDRSSANTPQLTDRLNLSITTGIDRAISPNLDLVAPTETGVVCLPNSQIDVNAWGDTNDPLALGQFRAGAISENGGLDKKGALKLARFYIAMGFGAEAQKVAIHLDENDRQLIFALGDIIDLGSSPSNAFVGQIYCNGSVALWAALAKPDEYEEIPEDTDHILSTFSSLAPHLRAHLGPALAELLRRAGQNEKARLVINAVTRGGDLTNESELAIARLDLDTTLAAPARKTLQNLSNGTDATAAKALLELLRDAERRGMPPNPDWITDDVPSLVSATEGTEVAASLNVAGLRGKIALEMFDSFRIALFEDTPGLDQNSRKTLAKLALKKAVATVSSTAFIKTELGLSKLVSTIDLPSDLRLDLANRLYSIGLPRRALAYLQKDPENQDEMSLKAKVLIATGNPNAAVDILKDEHGDQVSELLAEAHIKNGEEELAISAFSKSQNNEDALAFAVRKGNWAWVANQNTELSAAVRDLTTQQIDIDSSSPNGSLIEASRRLRSQARLLLESTNSDFSE